MGVWEEPGIQSTEKTAEEVTEEVQDEAAFHQNIHFFWLEGNGWIKE